MSAILLTQNAHLSSLYHLSPKIAGMKDTDVLCNLVTEAIVREIGAERAAAFLLDLSTQELQGVAASSGLPEVDTLRLPVEQEQTLQQALESGRVISYSRGRNGPSFG